jgi:hypothetical protein
MILLSTCVSCIIFQAELLTPSAVPKNADAPRNAGAEEAGPPPPVPVAAPEGWWFVGDQRLDRRVEHGSCNMVLYDRISIPMIFYIL